MIGILVVFKIMQNYARDWGTTRIDRVCDGTF